MGADESKQQDEIYELEVKRLKEAFLDISESRMARRKRDEVERLWVEHLEHAMSTNKVIAVTSFIQALSMAIIACLVAYSL